MTRRRGPFPRTATFCRACSTFSVEGPSTENGSIPPASTGIWSELEAFFRPPLLGAGFAAKIRAQGTKSGFVIALPERNDHLLESRSTPIDKYLRFCALHSERSATDISLGLNRNPSNARGGLSAIRRSAAIQITTIVAFDFHLANVTNMLKLH